MIDYSPSGRIFVTADEAAKAFGVDVKKMRSAIKYNLMPTLPGSKKVLWTSVVKLANDLVSPNYPNNFGRNKKIVMEIFGVHSSSLDKEFSLRLRKKGRSVPKVMNLEKVISENEKI